LPDFNVNIIDEDNFDTRNLNKSTKEITKNLNKYNKFFENSDEIYLNNSHEGKFIFIKKINDKN
jgi:hypothetical protein